MSSDPSRVRSLRRYLEASAADVNALTTAHLNGRFVESLGLLGYLRNYVRAEGADLSELEFDVMTLYQDAIQRSFSLPGTHIMAVAIGFEIWNGPVSNLQTEDFYVDVQ